MRPTLLSRLTSRPTGRLRVVLLAFLLAVMLGVTNAGGSAAEPPEPGEPTMPSAPDPDAGEMHKITLLTGDIVAWQRTADGKQGAWIVEPSTEDGSQPPAQIYEQDGQVHVIPAEAAPYLESGKLDPNLFNITRLVEQRLHDEAIEDLPLLVEATGGATARRAPATPNGARTVRELNSIKTKSVLAEKQEMRAVWESLRGPSAATFDSKSAELGNAGRVWLNGKVQATLTDAVSQIGAPKAWAAGYDGEGVSVAVLDTGWDAGHPDLQGVVSEAKNFTQEEDPAGVVALDGQGHGTHVAATVAGTGAASDGARKGVAPKASLMIGKVLDSNGEGWSDEIIAGMEWAANSGADLVNMSLGTPYASDGTDPFSQALNELTLSTGTLFVVAAGNSGPGETTVGSPGAAELALTVGAVDDDDKIASFSSRGPRLGDGAIKPEVVAPGVGIIAARAKGTALGNLIDANYTSLSGTSMASPVVAGAAAILAQQHPDWEAAELKARLVSTSKVLPDEPISSQGAGRVDVAAAIGKSLQTSADVLSLGAIPQDSAQVTRTLTYQNPTRRSIWLRLSADVTGLGANQRERARITFTDQLIRVPAGGSASTKVKLSPSRTETGQYAGQIIAGVVGQSVKLHTTISFSVDGPLRTITAKIVDRNGDPANGSVDIWSAETGAYDRIHIPNGTATTQVPDGLYAVMAIVGTREVDGFSLINQTFAGDPQLQIDRDITLNYDARDGRLVEVETPLATDVADYDVLWSRKVGDRSFKSLLANGRPLQDAYVIPSRQARTGSFEFATQWQFTQPMLTAQVSGEGGLRISPNPTVASTGDPYVGEGKLELVDAGNGTAEDYAAAAGEGKSVAGKAALVARSEEDLFAQVTAAKEAGVALLLVHNDREDLWSASVWRQGLPTYRLTQKAGLALKDALAADPGLTLDLVGLRDSEYAYELAFPHQGGLPRDVSYEVDQSDLAVVESDYRANSERSSRREGWVPVIGSIGVGNILGIQRNGPVKRTEYVSTEGVEWERMAQPHGEFPGYYWTWSAIEQYEAGKTTEQVWWGPLVHPAVVATYGNAEVGAPAARFTDAIRVLMPHYSYGGSVAGTIYTQMGDSSELTLRSGGEVLGKSSWSEGQFTVPPGDAEYELELEVTNGKGNWADMSVHTDSVWRFRSERTDEERTVLPLVEVDYGLDTDAHNDVAAGAPYSLRLDPGYQAGASGPGKFTVTVEVSYDAGENWVEAPVETVDGQLQADVPAASEEGYASVRVVATDADGNSLEQQIDRGWGISAQG